MRSLPVGSFVSSAVCFTILLTGCDLKNLANNLQNSSAGTGEHPKGAADANLDPALGMSDQQIIELYGKSGCNSLDGPAPVDDGGAQMPTTPDPINYRNGLIGKITAPPFDFRLNLDPWNNLDRYAQSDAIEMEEKLYFSQLNVPTRSFDQGFPLFSGEVATAPSGEKLYEYFRLDFDSHIVLNGEKETNYEFAVLSDDGARLQIGNNSETIIESPGVHATTLLCGSRPVALEQADSLPMHLAYFQGPRYHIAVMLLWREAGASAEPLCNQGGNEYWFDWTKTPSQPTNNFKELQSRGWKVIPPPNFELPATEPFNPCLSPHVQEVFARSSNQ